GHPDDLVLVDQRRGGAALLAQWAVAANVDGLGAADGGQVEEHAAVAGEAEAAGVCVAVAVEDDDVRLPAEAPPRGGDGGQLAEAEQARDVGERDVDGGGRLVHGLERLRVDHDDAGVAAAGEALDGEVRTGDEARGETARRVRDEPLAQLELQLARLG